MRKALIEKITLSGGTRLIAVRCPYCACVHHHGGGKIDEPLTLGCRSSHCYAGEYSLTQ